MTSRLKSACLAGLLALVYFYSARFGLRLEAVEGFATLVWPPTGISLAALLIFGTRLWPGVLLGATAVNHVTGAPLPVALGIGVGNTLEAVVGAYLLSRYCRLDHRLARVRDVICLIVVGAGLSTLISATVGVASLYASGIVAREGLGMVWRAWWIGDAIADLTIAPLLLVFAGRTRGIWFAQLPTLRRLEGLVLLVGLTLFTFLIFNLTFTEILGRPLARPFLVFPILIWSSLRFGQRGAVLSTVLVSGLALWFTYLGKGPFARADTAQNLLTMDIYVGAVAITALILGAAIEERLAAIEQLQDNHNLLKSILEATDDPILVKDPEGQYLMVNQAAARALGRTPHEIIGKHVREFLPPTFASAIAEGDASSLTKDRYSVSEEKLLVQGETRVFSYSRSPLRNSRGELVGMVGVGRDITDVKNADLEKERILALEKRALADSESARIRIEALVCRLEEAIRARDDFLSIASHELKTPMTAMKIQLQMARIIGKSSGEPVPPNDRIMKAIDMSERQLDRMVTLVEDLLDVARIKSGKLTLAMDKVDLSSLARDCLERFGAQLEAAKCATSLELAPNVTGFWDRSRIEQVLANLISNVIKYAPGKQVKIKVRGSAERATLIVEDTGPGIEADKRQAIFERFERANSAKNIAGLGLGLFIVKQVVEAHSGSIRVEGADIGTGARFIVELPVDPPSLKKADAVRDA